MISQNVETYFMQETDKGALLGRSAIQARNLSSPHRKPLQVSVQYDIRITTDQIQLCISIVSISKWESLLQVSYSCCPTVYWVHGEGTGFLIL